MISAEFDTKTLSEYIGYDRHHIYVLIRKKNLPFFKDINGIIKFNKSEVDSWLSKNNRIRKEKIRVKCAGCGNDFMIHSCRVSNTKNNYCSMKCRRNKKIISCDWCGKAFERIPASIENHNFCSRECMGKYQTKYYSGENSKHWIGDYNKYYGPNWRHQRNLARERDGFKCMRCGAKENEKQHDVHHIKAFALFGVERYKEANELSNLITLCNSCHTSVEERYKKANSESIKKRKMRIYETKGN